MARRKKSTSDLTPLELELLNVLWKQGPATVQQVQAALAPAKTLAYTTVQTVLNILYRKKQVHRRMEGRAFVYEAAVSHEAVAGEATSDLIRRLFGGSPERLLMSLVKSRQVDPLKLAELSRLLQQKEEDEP